ncbi:MAG: ACP S-malonyltransferase [Clostridiales bacterium]|nr:ACP S-malonyltransferase [Clostridiales bacterium]
MGKIAILFAGQGAQAPGMGKDIYEESKAAKALFDGAEKIHGGVIDTCFSGTEEQLKLTENAQPCLFLTGLAFANELKAAGIAADAVAGFSLGEIPALAYSGALSEEDAFKLVLARSKKMAELSKEHVGGMAAVLKLDAATVENACAELDEVWAVNYNSPGQIACAGAPSSIDLLIEKVKTLGGRAVKLAVSGAFHTPYMADASDTLKGVLDGMNISAPSTVLYSNLTGKPYPNVRDGIINNIIKQVCSPVRWTDIITDMHNNGVDTYIEVGVGATLTGLVKRTLGEVNTFTVTDVTSLKAAIEALKSTSAPIVAVA